MKVYCPMLLSGKYFPAKCAHRGVQGGQNISPQILWGDVPRETKSFVLSFIDLHPSTQNAVHWFIINIPHSTRELSEHASGDRDKMPVGALELRNAFGDTGYDGPNISKNAGPHEYAITVRALDVEAIPVGPFSTAQECEEEMQGKILASAMVTGIFRR